MKILVTGSSGFVGKNLVQTLNRLDYEVLSFDKDTKLEMLDVFTKDCDFVVHLAGVNRPTNNSEFFEGNASFSETLVKSLQRNNNTSPILVSSSIQVDLDNDYGKSKQQGESILMKHSSKMESALYIYRFTNIFGKWSKPNYNSVIATWCYNIARGKQVIINDPTVIIPFVYIDDVVQEIVDAIEGKPHLVNGIGVVETIYEVSLGEVFDLLVSFKNTRKNKFTPNLETDFSKKLYSTYLSFLPENDFSYTLETHSDDRGSFTEFLKTKDSGQVSINVSKPGVTKGQHWHHTKNEKFLVVSGEGVIQLRDVNSDKKVEYVVSDKNLEVIDIPVGYTHNIINIGKTDMITVMWANEVFDPENPDTYYEEV